MARTAGLPSLVLVVACALGAQDPREPAPVVDLERLLGEMVDLDELARRPDPFYRTACASSYSRRSHEGGDAWFDNVDVGQYVRTETVGARVEHVLADLRGPGAVARSWSANPRIANTVRFYFDGEETPRLELPFSDLFAGAAEPFGPAFSYVSGTGGNLYFPLPYAESLRVTVEDDPDGERPLRLYYEIAYRKYEAGTTVETFDPTHAARWREMQARVALALARSQPGPVPTRDPAILLRGPILPGQTVAMPRLSGARVVSRLTASLGRGPEMPEEDTEQLALAWRSILLQIDFDGQPCVRVPLGDFFGSGPGVNAYQSLLFDVDAQRMTSRLVMPFAESMELRLTNTGEVRRFVDIQLVQEPHDFGPRDQHLHAQWGTLTRDSWPPFDTTLLETTGTGKLVGSVYQIANPVLIWWGEGDQKVFVDGEEFPSTFGTGTEDDYGFAYGYNRPFARPYHAQTRVDGPASGGHISLSRWYVLDALPYRDSIRFDQEIWHWMPCRPTWSHVVYWYAAPGTPGPREIDTATLAPVDLGVRADMLDPLEGELLPFEVTGGRAGPERLTNCSRAEHLVWREGRPGDALRVRLEAPEAGDYSIELNLCMSPEHGRYRFRVNGVEVSDLVDCRSPELYWLQPRLGVFPLAAGENVLEAELLEPAAEGRGGSLLGLDYVFLVRN